MSIEPWKGDNPGTRNRGTLSEKWAGPEDEWVAGIPEPSYNDSSFAWCTQDPPKNNSVEDELSVKNKQNESECIIKIWKNIS